MGRMALGGIYRVLIMIGAVFLIMTVSVKDSNGQTTGLATEYSGSTETTVNVTEIDPQGENFTTSPSEDATAAATDAPRRQGNNNNKNQQQQTVTPGNGSTTPSEATDVGTDAAGGKYPTYPPQEGTAVGTDTPGENDRTAPSEEATDVGTDAPGENDRTTPSEEATAVGTDAPGNGPTNPSEEATAVGTDAPGGKYPTNPPQETIAVGTDAPGGNQPTHPSGEATAAETAAPGGNERTNRPQDATAAATAPPEGNGRTNPPQDATAEDQETNAPDRATDQPAGTSTAGGTRITQRPGIRCFSCRTTNTSTTDNSCTDEQPGDRPTELCDVGEVCWVHIHSENEELVNITRGCGAEQCNDMHTSPTVVLCDEAHDIKVCTQCCTDDLCNQYGSTGNGPSMCLSGIMASVVAVVALIRQ